MKNRILIVGAGLIGTSCAYHLSKNPNNEITVIDRQPGVGLETSYANGGQISVSHAEPWANPSAPFKVLSWLFKEDAPLLFTPRFDIHQLRWCLGFLQQCTPSNTNRNIRDIVRLGIYSREQLQKIRVEENLNYDQRTEGILHFYTDQTEFDNAKKPTELMRSLGCDRNIISHEECYEIEPTLICTRKQLVGGTYTAEDESGDAHKFTTELAKIAEKNGVKFMFNQELRRLEEFELAAGVAISYHAGYKRTVHYFDQIIIANGSYSAPLLRNVGVNLNVYPAKGYSATIKIPEHAGVLAPTVSLTDDEKKIVISRLGDRLRVAGTAELNGYNTDLNDVRCTALLTRLKTLFPMLMSTIKPEDVTFWTGLRPATPSNVPYIGKVSKYENLYVATGHGTLGWTEACGTGKIMADLINGDELEIDWNTNIK